MSVTNVQQRRFIFNQKGKRRAARFRQSVREEKVKEIVNETTHSAEAR